MPIFHTYKFQFMASYVLSDYRSIQMLLQESFIRPLYDRLPLPFLSISFGQVVLLPVPEGSMMVRGKSLNKDRRVVSEFEMSELGGSASLSLML